MKKTIILSTLLLSSWVLEAQIPLPGRRYTEENFTSLQSFSGQASVIRLDIATDQQTGVSMTHLEDSQQREFILGEGQIEPGFSYLPAPASNGELRLSLGQASEMEGAWFEPVNYLPQLYEKIEWGVKLPEAVENAIDNWIHNDQHPDEPPMMPALNPFDPEQVDLKAIIDYTTSDGVYFTQPVFGFFYMPFSRNTVFNNPHNEDLDDPDNWYWEELNTPYRFRFRWASTAIAQHSVRIELNVPSMGQWEMAPFEFNSYWGDPRNSFISVTENGHYFKTADEHVYFPVGLNINEGSFGCNCMETYNDNTENEENDALPAGFCDDCYEWGYDDPCCGISRNKRKRAGIAPEFDENGESKGVKGYTLGAAAYVKLERILETLQEKGANSFRTLIDPTQYDLEFEKLNNYYDRQYQAWEIDKMLEKCNELDLRIEFNMMIHYAICSHHDGFDKFDWDYSQNCYGCGEEVGNNGTHGYCYWRELELDTPIDFMTNPTAIAYYKKKIRYFIARYGYSKNIFLLELLSEANNIGKVWLNENGTDLNNDGDVNDTKVVTENPYNNNMSVVRPAVAAWHHEIARYIKEDLQHREHMIGACYTGPAPITGSENPCQEDWYDWSWQSNFIDVMAFSHYGGPINKFEVMTNDIYGLYDSIYTGTLCGWDNPDFSNDDTGWHSPIMGYQSVWKPIINSEIGNYAMGEDYTGFIKELVVSPFTGFATTGMSWDEWSRTEYWHWMGVIRNFLENEILNSIALNNEDWQPYHASSNCTPFGQEQVEAIYLKRTDPIRVFGVLVNRTWNWYTKSENFQTVSEDLLSLSLPEQNKVMPISYRTLMDLGFSEEAICIEEMGVHSYRIKYFDPLTNYIINQETVPSAGLLPLQNYPMLTDQRPIVFFKLYEQQQGEFFETDISHHDAKSDTPSSVIPTEDSSNLNQVRLYPVPCSTNVVIESAGKSIGFYEIFDATGRKVDEGWSKHQIATVDVTSLANGFYLIKINDHASITFQKID